MKWMISLEQGIYVLHVITARYYRRRWYVRRDKAEAVAARATRLYRRSLWNVDVLRSKLAGAVCDQKGGVA